MKGKSRTTIAVEEEGYGGQQGAPPLRESALRLAGSVYRLGKTAAAAPLALLPEASRGHMREAGSSLEEAGKAFTRGVAAALRAAAANIEEMAEEAATAKK